MKTGIVAFLSSDCETIIKCDGVATWPIGKMTAKLLAVGSRIKKKTISPESIHNRFVEALVMIMNPARFEGSFCQSAAFVILCQAASPGNGSFQFQLSNLMFLTCNGCDRKIFCH
jgi:hypothetical protein